MKFNRIYQSPAEDGTEGATTVKTNEPTTVATPKQDPAVINGELYAEVKANKAKYQAAREDLKTASAELEALKAKVALYGAEPDEVAALKQAQSDREEALLLEQNNFAEAKAALEAKNQERIDAMSAAAAEKQKALEDKIALQNQKNEELLRTNQFAKSKFVKDELDVSVATTRALFDSHFDQDEDGNMVPYSAPKGAAKRVMLVDDEGEPLEFDKAMEKLVAAHPDGDSFRKSKVKVGSGGKPNVGKAGKEKSKLTGMAKVAAARLKAQAGSES